MPDYEVPEPILNSPFDEPREHWYIAEGEPPERRSGRRMAMYYYRDPKAKPDKAAGSGPGVAIELKLVSRIRKRLQEWRRSGYVGASRTTLDLLAYWRRDGRKTRLFFAQFEAAETIIFLTEGRADLRQGLDIPVDEPSAEMQAEGFKPFVRFACKMATGSGKTTVMGMLAA